jgi:hypothetical protein
MSVTQQDGSKGNMHSGGTNFGISTRTLDNMLEYFRGFLPYRHTNVEIEI